MLNRFNKLFPAQPDGSRLLLNLKTRRCMTKAEVASAPPDLTVRFIGPIKTETKRVFGSPVSFKTGIDNTAFFPTITISTRISYLPPELRSTE